MLSASCTVSSLLPSLLVPLYLLCPPSRYLPLAPSLSLSLHPLTSPVTIQSNHPSLSSSLAAFRSTFVHTSSSSSSFYLPAPAACPPPRVSLPLLGFVVLLLYLRLCSFIVVVSRLSPSPPCSSPILYCRHPSLFRSPATLLPFSPSHLSFSFLSARSARPVSSLKRTKEEWYDAQT